MRRVITAAPPPRPPCVRAWPPHVVTLGLAGCGEAPVSMAVLHASAETLLEHAVSGDADTRRVAR
jgi:hypothetical protein